MRITSRKWILWRRSAAGAAVGGLLAGLLATPAFADEAPAVGPIADRVTAVQAWKDGGPAVKRAAETALAGSDSDVHAFVTSGRQAAADADLRAKVEKLIASSGPEVRKAATKALAGTPADLQAFLDNGYKVPFADDQRILATQIMAVGGPEVRKAVNKVLSGSLEDVNEFLATGQYVARNDDDRIKTTQLMATGGPEVRAAANVALSGTMDDVHEFLRYGYQTASAHDAETLTISQLADLTSNAASLAGEQAKAAQDGADQALAASALAKQAAEKAAAETKAAQGDAKKASAAAGKAADAVERAAKAAQTASEAATCANEAARQAAAAAADAARASSLAETAATQAQDAAAKAAGNAGDAAKARDAAVNAKKLSAEAKSISERAQWVVHASEQAEKASQAANQASANADAAASAAAEAAAQAGVSDEARDRTKAAADRARTAAAEARRASAQVQKIAADAKAAADQAQRAASSSAGHAEAAAAAAEQAAAHAGDAATAAATAQAAATAAKTAADAAADASMQAHKVADVARASDTERLAAQQAAEVAAAQQAYFDEAAKAKQAAWESGKANELAADTLKLLAEATTPGVDQSVAVAKGRLAATRLLTAGGPWVQAAAQGALEGHDADVLAFLSADLALARERDDRASVTALAAASTKVEQRLAAEAAAVGTPEAVRDFLAHGTYPGKNDDDRILTTQIMAAGGPEVRKAANVALSGTMDDVHFFLTTSQYTARNDDNAILVTQAMANGGPEVRAAANAVLSGPKSGLEPFLKIGLPRAQQRDAATAAHVATVASYLQAIDGNVAKARQSAAQAAQSYATARGAASEAAGYANQAQASATEAANWATQAAESARQAKASADQAAAYAVQARASAANATAAVRTADRWLGKAEKSAQDAHTFAARAKEAADRAFASKMEAQSSAAEARKAAVEAFNQAYKNSQSGPASPQAIASDMLAVGDDSRIYYIEVVPRSDMQQEVLSQDIHRCDRGGTDTPRDNFTGTNWYLNNQGEKVCDVPVTAKFTGTIDYVMWTCPEANLTVDTCRGKNSVWDRTVLYSVTLDGKETKTTVQITWKQYQDGGYQPACGALGLTCVKGIYAAAIADLVFGDIIRCIEHPGINLDCTFAVANLLPGAIALKGAKAVAAFRLAVATGVGTAEAGLALDAAFNVANKALSTGLKVSADSIASLRNLIKGSTATDAEIQAALKSLGADPNVERSVVEELQGKNTIRQFARSCPTRRPNSFPAGTQVLMGDGTTRAIETLRIGDTVTATDPATGDIGPRTVTNTIYTPDDRDFTEITVSHDDGAQSAVTATDHHPFWVESTHTWTDAANLHTGDTLRTNTGATVQVASIRHWTGLEPAYNLTVDGLHTYYVLAGEIPLLVHNTDYSVPCDLAVEILNQLPVRTKQNRTTVGEVLMPDPVDPTKLKVTFDPIISGTKGAESLVAEISNYLRNPELGLPYMPEGSEIYTPATHTETKFAWRMAEEDIDFAEILINNSGGPCGLEVPGDYTCVLAIPKILYTDQTLIVRWLKDGEELAYKEFRGTRLRP